MRWSSGVERPSIYRRQVNDVVPRLLFTGGKKGSGGLAQTKEMPLMAVHPLGVPCSMLAVSNSRGIATRSELQIVKKLHRVTC